MAECFAVVRPFRVGVLRRFRAPEMPKRGFACYLLETAAFFTELYVGMEVALFYAERYFYSGFRNG